MELGEYLQKNFLREILFGLPSRKMVPHDFDHNRIEPLNEFFRSRIVGVACASDQLKNFVARHVRSREPVASVEFWVLTFWP